MADRQRPDDFESPAPHSAPSKSVVDAVFSGLIKTGNGVVSLLSGLLASVLILYSGYVLYDSFSTQYHAYSSAWELLQYKPEIIEDSLTPLGGSTLSDINSDYTAWLTVYDSSIDYPVMQGSDDLYYASHDIYKKSSLTGAIYLAAANSSGFYDEYNLIYGHHMDNGAMFGRLDSFRDAGYFYSHQDGVIITNDDAYDVTFFAVAETDAYESKIYTVGDRRDELLEFLTSAPVGTPLPDGVGLGTTVLRYDAGVADSANKIVALSTCASATTSGRLVVFGAMSPRLQIEVVATDYYGVYDGEPHTITATPSIIPGTTLEFSTDGGETWSTEYPTRTEVGVTTVEVRATNERHGVATTTATITIVPAPLTVTAPSLDVMYDGMPYYTIGTPSVVPGTTVEYSADNGGTWSTVPPEFIPVGLYPVMVRATNPNYETATTTATINIRPAGVALTIVKQWVGDDPADRPALLRVVLAGGEQDEIVTLSAANNWTATVTVPAGGDYYWLEPDVPGYTQTSVTTENGVTTVVNTREAADTPNTEHTLTINYRFTDGRQAAPSYVETLAEGTDYSVASPNVPGYRALTLVVTGTMPGRDVELTVLYIPTNTPDDFIVIDGYGTPLGVNGAYIDTGDCFE